MNCPYCKGYTRDAFGACGGCGFRGLAPLGVLNQGLRTISGKHDVKAMLASSLVCSHPRASITLNNHCHNYDYEYDLEPAK